MHWIIATLLWVRLQGPTLGEADTAKLIEQAPAVAALVLVVGAFLGYLAKLNRSEARERREREDRSAGERRDRAAREERLETVRTEAIRSMSESCHAAHRQLAEESRASVAALKQVLDDNNKLMGQNLEALRETRRGDGPGRRGPG